MAQYPIHILPAIGQWGNNIFIGDTHGSSMAQHNIFFTSAVWYDDKYLQYQKIKGSFSIASS